MANVPDPWSALNRFTQARIGLGRAGVSLPTKVQLKFNADHALARDAVQIPLNTSELTAAFDVQGIAWQILHSRASDRREYLQRPDFGRRLDQSSCDKLNQFKAQHPSPIDIALVLVDGLSSTAVQLHGVALATALLDEFKQASFTTSQVMLVEQGRVAIGDEIGELLGARTTVLIVGERPGLSSPDSLGIYFTYDPKIGSNDARRNCISNIRPAGLSIQSAVHKCVWLLKTAIKLQLSGVALKDNSDEASLEQTKESKSGSNFLLP